MPRALEDSNVAAPEDGRTPLRSGQAQPAICIAETCTARSPFVGQPDESCLYGVIFYVAAGAQLVVTIAHVCIPIPCLPKGALASQKLVCLLGGITLPSVDQVGHWHALNLEKQVYMVGHDHPGLQVVFHAITEEQSRFYHFGNRLKPQMTSTSTSVQVSFQLDALLAIVFNSQQGFPFQSQGLREGVGQSEGDELGQSGRVAVWEITALKPAEKALFKVIRREWRGPRLLAPNQVADTWIIGRTIQPLSLHAEESNTRSERVGKRRK